jgi:hypothetical protein
VGHREAPGDLPSAESHLEVKSEHLLDLPHGHPPIGQ